MAPEESAFQYRTDNGRVGIAQRTGDGFLRCYMRLAVADKPYTYRSASGNSRREVIPADELFKTDSVDSFKMLPVTLRHPQSRVVTPDNASDLMKGSTGHTVIREKTPHGEFLGITASVYDRETIDAIEDGWQISPGYRVKTRLRTDGVYDQYDRQGNHTAVVQKARGGDDVIPVLSGINIDSENDEEFWYQDALDEELWTIKVDSGLILPLLEKGEPEEGIATKTPIILTPAQDKSLPTNNNDMDNRVVLEDPAPPVRVRKGKKSKRCKKGCGSDCDCAECTNKYKTDSMATINIDGVGHEVDQDLAHLVQPHLDRSLLLDDMIAERDALQTQLDSLQESYEELESESEELGESASTILESYEELKEQLDSIESDSFNSDSDDSPELNLEAIKLVDRIREDGKLLVDRGLLEEFNTDAEYILENIDQLQREMVGFANPGLNTDSYDSDSMDVAYDVAFATLRSIPNTNADSDDVREDMKHKYYKDGAKYYKGKKKSKKKGEYDEDEYDEEMNEDGMYPHGSLTLSNMPSMVSPKAGKKQGVRSILRNLRKMDDEAFDNATHDIKPMSPAGFGQINMM